MTLLEARRIWDDPRQPVQKRLEAIELYAIAEGRAASLFTFEGRALRTVADALSQILAHHEVRSKPCSSNES